MAVAVAAPVDLKAIKARQRATWADGDFGVIGTTTYITSELLVEAAAVRAGETVLDVATGTGNAAIAAARRWGAATGVDYVPALLERARERAVAERLPIQFMDGDAEELPFGDSTFDAVLSVYGTMFAPDQTKAASELVRVAKPGGRIGLASWSPQGFIGHLFKTIGKYVPPPAGLRSPMTWGTEEGIQELLGERLSGLRFTRQQFVFNYASPEHFLHVFRTYYGPTVRAFAALDEHGQVALAADIVALAHQFNPLGESRMAVPSDYLEVVGTVR